RLFGYGFRIAAGVRVPVFTRALEQGRRDPAERRLCIIGDRGDLGVGERQRMYRDLDRYLVRCKRPASSAPDDLLLAAAEGAPSLEGVTRVFGEGEQGQGCHMALLGVAMVVETRLPGASMIAGRFDQEQADAARRWASGILGRSLALPVRVSG